MIVKINLNDWWKIASTQDRTRLSAAIGTTPAAFKSAYLPARAADRRVPRRAKWAAISRETGLSLDDLFNHFIAEPLAEQAEQQQRRQAA